MCLEKSTYQIMIVFSVDQCDEEYLATAEPERLTNPGYPNGYFNYIDSCVTAIYANESRQRIELNFEAFDLEQNYDSLEV